MCYSLWMLLRHREGNKEQELITFSWNCLSTPQIFYIKHIFHFCIKMLLIELMPWVWTRGAVNTDPLIDLVVPFCATFCLENKETDWEEVKAVMRSAKLACRRRMNQWMNSSFKSTITVDTRAAFSCNHSWSNIVKCFDACFFSSLLNLPNPLIHHSWLLHLIAPWERTLSLEGFAVWQSHFVSVRHISCSRKLWFS